MPISIDVELACQLAAIAVKQPKDAFDFQQSRGRLDRACMPLLLLSSRRGMSSRSAIKSQDHALGPPPTHSEAKTWLASHRETCMDHSNCLSRFPELICAMLQLHCSFLAICFLFLKHASQVEFVLIDVAADDNNCFRSCTTITSRHGLFVGLTLWCAGSANQSYHEQRLPLCNLGTVAHGKSHTVRVGLS